MDRGNIDKIAKTPEDLTVQTSGAVDTDKVGTYVITYTAEKWNCVGTATRVIHVVDVHAPVIELVSDPNKFTFPNEP